MGYSRKKLDLNGCQFGQLTVVAPAENANGRTAWRCKCSCGREVIVKTSHLREGRTRSCGCLGRGPAYVDGTCPEMLRAAKVARSNNTSGVPGVDWRTAKGLWRASICFKGKRYYLGSYAQFEDAVRARKEAEYRLHDQFLDELSADSLLVPASR
ncbi:MAG: hypothetical protein HFE45_11350 [Oscillospiraceae bacterium]|nr:hypothetical protein [Oscillospiraceae bacterium]